jgi:hypothetical protein
VTNVKEVEIEFLLLALVALASPGVPSESDASLADTLHSPAAQGARGGFLGTGELLTIRLGDNAW